MCQTIYAGDDDATTPAQLVELLKSIESKHVDLIPAKGYDGHEIIPDECLCPVDISATLSAAKRDFETDGYDYFLY